MNELDLIILEGHYNDIINKYINSTDETVNVLLEILNKLFEEIKENVNDYCKSSYTYGIVFSFYTIINKLQV